MWNSSPTQNSIVVSDLKSSLHELISLCMHGENVILKGICDILAVYLRMPWQFYSIISVMAFNFFNRDQFFWCINALNQHVNSNALTTVVMYNVWHVTIAEVLGKWCRKEVASNMCHCGHSYLARIGLCCYSGIYNKSYLLLVKHLATVHYTSADSHSQMDSDCYWTLSDTVHHSSYWSWCRLSAG